MAGGHVEGSLGAGPLVQTGSCTHWHRGAACEEPGPRRRGPIKIEGLNGPSGPPNGGGTIQGKGPVTGRDGLSAQWGCFPGPGRNANAGGGRAHLVKAAAGRATGQKEGPIGVA